jgi:RNA recognition motif-containing protein
LIAGRPVFISRCNRDKSQRESVKYSTTIEPNKIFVKGVSYDATSDDLKELFGKFGEIKGLRIVTHK